MLIRKIEMECPICDKVHNVEEHSRIMKLFVRGQNIEYEERYFLCQNTACEKGIPLTVIPFKPKMAGGLHRTL